jgi:predicted permease
MVGRLGPSRTVQEAQAQLDAHNAAVESTSAQAARMAEAGFRSVVVPLHADHVAAIRPALLLVQAGAFCLLLIGIVNLANLLLIRFSGRARQLAIRQAIGASRARIVVDVVTETMVLFLSGALCGLGVAAIGTRALSLLGTDHFPLGSRIAFDARVAAVGLAAAVLAGMATGLGLAWYGLRQPPLHGLRIETRATTASRAAQRLRHGFIVAQVALALVLLSGAGVLVLSLRNAMAVAPGFRADHVLTGHVRIGGPAHQGHAAALAFTDQLLQEIARSPGVRSVALATNVPLSGQSMKSSATVKSDARPRDTPHAIYSYGVTGDYFAAMGLPVRAGRALSSADTATRARVCVVDESFARRHWPGGNAIGQQLWQGGAAGGDDELFTVVGVVGDVKQAAVTDATPQGAVYYTLAHRRDDEAFIVVRTAAAPEPFAAVLRQVVRRLDADLPIDDLQSMDGRIAESLVARRSPALLAMAFAMLAVLLTAIGTYGVLGYAVAQRRREIGLRMALGARPSQVRRHFLVMAVRLIGAGIGFGVPTAWLTGGAFEAVLFQVPASHPAMQAGSAVVVGLVSLVACVIPSHRAARTPSLAALLDE